MLREIVCMAAFLFAFAGVVGSMVIVQREAGRQSDEVARIMAVANEID